jgi:hypothetical protein
MPDHHHHSEIANMHMDQSKPGRNARQRISQQQRARICEQIARQIALEFFSSKTSKREAIARMAIGLRPFPRTIHGGRC